MKDGRIRLELPQWVFRALMKACRRDGVGPATWCERAIREALWVDEADDDDAPGDSQPYD